jgi:asparagine synthase (glutamine-hydrolysing)
MSVQVGQRTYFIAYNGEVYNFSDLRRHLQNVGFSFLTNSDTEVVLASHIHWGVRAVEYLDGMFAYAIWDSNFSELTLVRDRLGIKPLFYTQLGDTLIFASEPKALFLAPNLRPSPNITTILEYFLHGSAFASGYATNGHSFYQGLSELSPGHLLKWSSRDSRPIRYWSPLQEFGSLRSNRSEAEEELAEKVTRSVRDMQMGEVMVGTALSGGLDSSILTTEAIASTERALFSATITYREDFSDPDPFHARLLSEQLNKNYGGRHHLKYTHLKLNNYLDQLDEMVVAFDEPHWELRQLAMFENYRTLAEAGCTVVLTGEGADELFFGYYRKFPGFRSPEMKSPADFAAMWRQRIPWVKQLLAPAFASKMVTGETAEELIGESTASYLTPYWKETGSRLRAIQCWYLHTFLSWLLMDNDRCSMAHSIEGRFPFLSRALVSLALNLPPEWNIAEKGIMQEKTLLRQAFKSRLPPEIWRDRIKAPLPVPLAVSYHVKIAQRLLQEIEEAPVAVWDILDKAVVTAMAQSFLTQALTIAKGEAESMGESMTSYIPLGQPLHVRTAHLFAILTFLRWYSLCIDGNWSL